VCGCQKPDEIVGYTVAKPPARQSRHEFTALKRAPVDDDRSGEAAAEGQLLGAILPREETTWFFKILGPRAAVETQTGSFVQFVKSIKFSRDRPEWVLPEGWKEEPASKIRFATLRITTDEGPLELSVIPLPTGQGKIDEYVLSNVNRWREQVTLPPLAPEELPANVVKFDLDGGPVWLVNLVGILSGQPMGATGGGEKDTPRRKAAPDSPGRDSLPFTCEVPEGWKTAKAGTMQLAAFEVRDGNRKATITVSTAGGDLAANINRWRGQIQLDPLPEPELEKTTRKIEVDGNEALTVDLIGPEKAEPREAILGVIVEARGRQWFIKLKGDADLAAREKEHFNEFVQSIRFRGRE
jgi:hypothetical protein